VKFNRLGYLSLESNEKSGYQARELKSVYVDAFSLLLKIVLHKCHVNKFNLYNQVGVIAINCMGEISKAKQAITDKDNATFEEMMQMDEVTLERVKSLKTAKDKAIKMEDYDEAKRLKEAIERLRSVGTHLAQLEERKKIAIDNEDFDAAKIIKTEIDRLRKTALDPAYNNGPYSDQPKPTEVSRPFSSGPEAPLADPMPLPKMGGRFGGKVKEDFDVDEGMQDMSLNDPPVKKKPVMPINKKDVFGGGPGKGPGKGIQFPSEPTVFEEEKFGAIPMGGPENIDDQVIPAARNKGIPEDGGIIGGGDNKPTEVEDLKGEDVKLAAPLIPVFGEETVKKLFSKNWVNRENGLIEIEEIVNSNPDSD
jgi:centrosomal protein CEP104